MGGDIFYQCQFKARNELQLHRLKGVGAGRNVGGILHDTRLYTFWRTM